MARIKELDGELHARVIHTDNDEVMDLMQEVIYKGFNRNPNRLMSPPQANSASDLDKSLTEWTHTKNDCGRGPEIQDGRRDDANKLVEDHAPQSA